MDTTEQTSGYYFDGFSNISAGELYFWVFLDEAGKQLGVTDLAGLAMFILGQPIMSTRAKPMGTTKGTSPLSYYLRQWLTTEVKQWRTLTTGSIRRLKFSYVDNLGAFVARWIPFLGIVILASDISQIVWKSTSRYNTIAKESDRLC